MYTPGCSNHAMAKTKFIILLLLDLNYLLSEYSFLNIIRRRNAVPCLCRSNEEETPDTNTEAL
jgi:hypothetical protein